MKKTYDLGCTKKCPVKEFLYKYIFYEFIYELIYEFIYVNTPNMNSYMSSYMNKHNMAIRVFQIWLSGCSRSERRRRLRLWRRGSGESPNQRGWLWRAKAGSGAIGVRRAAASDWAAAIEAGCGGRAAATDYRDSPRQVAPWRWAAV